ncbi:endogenous retrovirus group K member 7 Env polyprotein-like [Cervus canadensis]|uniref:endogenous retrovirus group K member 7 Env polyprotein-like n=1 Tax=Cervus canadensis TaxID=1574408 RepID=UPI001C9E23E8|nr:endogenous retrovirus group K member 7 Env polyprotein-like [Cervus canadensis]
MYTNGSNKLQIYPNYTGGPTIVTCDQCILSTSVTSSFNIQAFVILKRPPNLMIPVNSTGIWYDNYELLVLQQVKELLRSRRLIGLLILGISALIASIASVTVAAVSLLQQAHTAWHVNDLSKNVSLTLATQETIDRKLEAKVDALEEAVLHIGTELQALRVRLSPKCHAEYRWICVTPLKVNYSSYSWDQVRNHIVGIWNSSDTSIDLTKLHQEIKDIGQSHLDFSTAQTANAFFTSLSNFISHNNLLSSVLGIVASIFIVVILFLLLPCTVRILIKSIKEVSLELHSALLKNKKGRDVGSRRGAPKP